MSDQLFYDAILNGNEFGKKLAKDNTYNKKYWFDLGKNNPYSFSNEKNAVKKSVYYFCPLILSVKDGIGKELLDFLQTGLTLTTSENFYFDNYGNIKFDNNIIKNPIASNETNFNSVSIWNWMIQGAGNSGMHNYMIDFSKSGAMISNIYLNYLLYYDGNYIRLLYNPIHRSGFYSYISRFTGDDVINIQLLLQNYSESVVTISQNPGANNPHGTIFADPTCNCWYKNKTYSSDTGWDGDSALPNVLTNGENIYDYSTYMEGIEDNRVISAFTMGGKSRQYCMAPACFWKIAGTPNAWGTINGTWDKCDDNQIVDTTNVPLCMAGIYYLMGASASTGGQQACPENIINEICNNSILNQGGKINIGTSNSTCSQGGGPTSQDGPHSCSDGICSPNSQGNYKNLASCNESCRTDAKGTYSCNEKTGKCSKVPEGQGYTTDSAKCASDCSVFVPDKENSNHIILIIIITLIVLLIIGVSTFLIFKYLKKNSY